MYIKYYLFCIIILNCLVAEIYPLAQKPFLQEFDPAEDRFERGTYLIVIAEADLEDILIDESVGDFIYFKRTQGYNVEIWNYEEIGSKEQLRNDLSNYYTDNLLEYVLLIGDSDLNNNGELDEDDYPIESYTITSYNDNTSPHDVTDHLFTYFSGDQDTEDGLYPKCFVGRWSIEKDRELKAIQRKTIRYIKMGHVVDSSYVDRALIVAGGFKLDADSNPVFPFKWPITPIWTSYWLQNRLSQYGYSTIDTALYYVGNMIATNPIIPTAWNNGVGIINYRGWGNRSGWDKPYFQNSDVDLLTPTWDLPIVFSFVCNTGDFGNKYLAFGEALIRAGNAGTPRGAVAMIGPSDLDTDTRFNNVLCGALWDGLLEGRTPELGQALHAAKQAVAMEFYGITEPSVNISGYLQNIPIFYHHVYGILGDPSIPVWLGTPSNIIVLNDDGIFIDDTLSITDKFIAISMQNESGESLQDVVGALLFNGDLIAKGLSTIDGYLDIDFSSNSDIAIGTVMELYLNKAQYYQKRIPVIFSEQNNNSFVTHSYGYQIPESPAHYDVKNIDYDWVEINPEDPEKVYNGENLYLTDDTIVKDIPIGFDFTYYGYTYPTINICSNGWAAFENSDIPYFENYSIPFPMGPSAMLAVFMDDLDDNGKEPFIDNNNNNIYDNGDDFFADCGTPETPILSCHDRDELLNQVYDDGEPFNVFTFQDEIDHRFIVQWDQVSNGEDDEKCNSVTGCVKETFQLILYDPVYQNNYGQGNIVFQYQEIYDIDDGRFGANGNLSTIGIESPDQNQGVQYLFNGELAGNVELTEGGLNHKAIQFSANQLLVPQEGTYLNIEAANKPSEFQLIEAYPNPFNPVATIRYTSPEINWIDLSIYNIRGQKVICLYTGMKLSGTYQFNWNASAYASGVYFITLSSPDTRQTKKILLLK